MFRNNFQIAIRIFFRQKGYSFINVFGLAVGLAACIFILLWVQDELSYDKFHTHAERIYLVGLDARLGNQEFKAGATPPPMAYALMDEFTGIDKATRFYNTPRRVIKYGDKIFTEREFYYADSTFFDIFSFDMLHGDRQSALDEPNSIVIARGMKEKYFGNDDPMGEVLRVGNDQDYRITGVCEDPPFNSHICFDFLASFSSLGERQNFNWGSNFLQTYILLGDNTSEEEINGQFPNLLEVHFGPIINAIMNISLEEFYEAGNRYYYFLEPLLDIHLHSELTERFEGSSDIVYVYVLSLIAVFILLIACINFVNLTTARSSLRAKEVGIKKILGSQRRHLIYQFLLESVILGVISMLLSVLIVELLLPSFNNLAEKNLTTLYLGNPLLLPSMILLSMFVGLVAGSYAAFFQSSVSILSVLKGVFAHTMKSGMIRNILVVFQFTISIFLIICTMTVMIQIRYVQNMDIGFNKEQVLIMERFGALGSQQQVFKDEVLKLPDVSSASIGDNFPGRNFSGNARENHRNKHMRHHGPSESGTVAGYSRCLRHC